MYAEIKEHLNNFYPVEDQLLDEYLSHWEAFSCSKKTIITREGQIERYLYFVLEGAQKFYFENEGKSHVIIFTYAPSFSGVPESFFTQTPSRYYFEAITDSKFLRVPFEVHEQFMEAHRPIETLFRKAFEAFLVGFVDRYYELMAFDIETRFRSFVARSPHLINMVPHKDLASYLRIDPTNFSKLLGKSKF